tara:strand:- start:3494 stop:4519 length:1026 start_codon:yes stop_codon:yes gene_type:complete
MINSFKQYLIEEKSDVYFTFGRMNPPTIGHEKLLTVLSKKAGRNPYKVFLSQSQDKKKNPLNIKEKTKFIRKMFPKHARSIILNPKIKTFFDCLVSLYNEGFKSVNMVVGSDRVREFNILIEKYNGKKGKHGFYNFKSMNVISAGDRDPDGEGASGMSATKMREAASKNDFTSFAQGLPRNISNSEAKNIYNTVRNGMGLKEQKEFVKHISLGKLSETREKYVKGVLYNIGDKVKIRENGDIGTVKILGSNYLIIEVNGKDKRQWLESVEPTRIKKFKTMYEQNPKNSEGQVTHTTIAKKNAIDAKNKLAKRNDQRMDRARLRDARLKNMLTKPKIHKGVA